MIVTYHGFGCVKASVGQLVFAFNPPSKTSKMKFSGFGADAALVSVNLSDYNGSDRVAYGDKDPFVVEGPGEYEVEGVFVKGFPSEGPKGSLNTIYVLELDDIKICHLGALSNAELTPETLEAIGEVDVLFVPTYNGDVLSSSEAHKLATRLGVKAVVPLFQGEKDMLSDFTKEAGEDKAKVLDKWTIKKKDLETMEGELVAIKSF